MIVIHGPAFPRARAEERGHDPHPDDAQPPAAHLMPAPGVDVQAVFAQQVRALRFVGALTRCAHPHCNTSLTEETVTYCPHDRPFCELCTREDGCAECDTLAWDAEIDGRDAS